MSERLSLWTAGELDRLKKMRAAGMSYADIGEALGRSLCACYRRHKRLMAEGSAPEARGRYVRWTAEDIERLAALRAEGLSMPAIAAQMGRSRNSLIGRLYRLYGSARAVSPPAKAKPRTLPARRLPAAESDAVFLPKKTKAPPCRSATTLCDPPSQILPGGAGPFRAAFVAPPEAAARAKPFLDLAYGDCRWPYDIAGGTRFCGAPAGDHRYCPEHAVLSRRRAASVEDMP